MIYQLMKRDIAWKGMPWCALVAAVAWTYPSTSSFLGVMVAMMSLFAVMPHVRATPFEAALPIEARWLLLSRILSVMALVWIPALCGAAGILIVKGSSAEVAKPLTVAALCTLLAAMCQSVWRKRLAGPHWILFLVFVLLPAAGPLLVDRPATLVAVLCASTGVALLAWAVATVPPSFQFIPAGVRAAPAASRAAAPATLAWAPVIRSVCSVQYAFFVLLMGLQVFTGQWLLSPFWLLLAWASPRLRMRWLWALPVGRRALLWTVMGPILAAHALGYAAGLLRRGLRPEPVVMVVTIACALAYVMLAILLIVLAEWRGFAGVSRRIRNTIFISVLGTWWAACMWVMFLSPWTIENLARDSMVRLAHALPLGLPGTVAVATAVLIALYAAIEKTFGEPEFADKPKPNQRDAFA